MSDRPGGFGGFDIWQVSISPVVDFDGDGRVDGKDVLTMARRWGEDDPLCDIGPMPWGDGIVDVRDLTVLAEYIGKEVDDPTLVAHWALDETEGMIAYDRGGDNDAAIAGAPVWWPADGVVDGALELNGVTSLAAGFVLDPADGPFSVFAWGKGGAPGQAILSQQGGVDWLMADSAKGTLATGLSRASGGRFAPDPLVSESTFTDGDWHRVGFTWDGTSRALYLDDVLVAEDTQDGLGDCFGGLNLGAGTDMTTGSFFSGLIDDVRIYNRAVKP